VHVSAGQIAFSLVVTMLVPLGIGLFVKARYAEAAALYQPTVAHASNISLILLLVLVVGLNVGHVLGLLGSGALLAVLLLTAVAVGSGYLLGGPGQDTRRVLALGTGQRNVAAGFVVATSNFAATPDVLVLLAASGLILDAIMIPLAGEFGRLSRASVSAATPPGRTGRTGRTPAEPAEPTGSV
jgi:BASS family bile acid:Na+ symporter